MGKRNASAGSEKDRGDTAKMVIETGRPESVRIPVNGSFIRKFFAFAGPGLLVAVGYMDPGNWATDIEGGSRFGYILLSIILISNLFAILLQYLALKLGIATETDLAQACRKNYGTFTRYTLWVLAEVAIAATDIAEVIGAAIALNILFDIPFMLGIVITVLDVLVLLFFQHRNFRWIEGFVSLLILLVMACFLYELISSHPDFVLMVKSLIPQPEIIENSRVLYLAIGILGATVMPHNLYLHSNIVQSRDYPRTVEGKKIALWFASFDSTLSLSVAFFINAAILVTAAAAFHYTGHREVAHIRDAYELLTPILGTAFASTVFAVALLASGQNSTITGTMAGQIVMEGFIRLKMKSWLRRLLTRVIAIIPSCILAYVKGANGVNDLLVLSQVILSLQLSFAVFPLVSFTSDREKMGEFVNSKFLTIISWMTGLLIAFLNGLLLYFFVKGQ